MARYTINFLADVDVSVNAGSPQEARRKAKEMFGEYTNKQFEYAYICEIRYIADEEGNEV